MIYNILIVDDALFMRNMIKDIFADKKIFNIVGEAENGKEAINKYKELRPDLVTMDITMPEIDGIANGIAATREILKFDEEAKIVICSAIGQDQHIMDAIEAGACDYITKPPQSGDVLRIVKSILGIIP
ncbi:MAG: response regulator [bacterium]